MSKKGRRGKRSQRSKQHRRAPKPKNYRTERYIEYIFRAEVGVSQAATLLPELTDGEVLDALRELVDQIRSNGWPRFQEQPPGTDGLIAWLIVQEWEDLFHRRGRLSKRDMAGCLNTVIESAETRARRSAGRRYLRHLEKFMKRAGVSVEMMSVEEFAGEEAEDELFYDLEQMSLAELGTLFLNDPDILGIDDVFENRAHAHISSGNADEVVTLCRQLLEQADEPYTRAILHTLLGVAYRSLGDLERAVAMFQAAQSPELTYTDALDKLADTYREMGQYEQAIQTWRECLADPRSDAYFHRQIAQTYRQLSDLAARKQPYVTWLWRANAEGVCCWVGARAIASPRWHNWPIVYTARAASPNGNRWPPASAGFALTSGPIISTTGRTGCGSGC